MGVLLALLAVATARKHGCPVRMVESIGNANDEVIRKYVQEQLTELDRKESSSKQLGLF